MVKLDTLFFKLNIRYDAEDFITPKETQGISASLSLFNQIKLIANISITNAPIFIKFKTKAHKIVNKLGLSWAKLSSSWDWALLQL